MADLTIDTVPSAAALSDSDKVLAAQGDAVLKRSTVGAIRTAMATSFPLKSGDTFTGAVNVASDVGARFLNLGFDRVAGDGTWAEIDFSSGFTAGNRRWSLAARGDDGNLVLRTLADNRTLIANILAVTRAGNVAIGNTSPPAEARLQVVGGAIMVERNATGTFGDFDNRGQLILCGATNASKRLAMGVDTTAGTMFGVIQAIEASVTTRALALNPGGGELHLSSGSSVVRPGSDNAQNLGASGNRWATVFAGTGTINTSDAREKDQILPITDDLLDKWSGVEAVSFKFKGRNRTHFGYTAQQVLESMGEDAFTYALLCKDAITKPVKRTVKKLVQKTEAKTINDETIEVIDGVPTVVVKTREVQEPVFEMVQVIGADGKPVMVEREVETEGEPDEDGNPTKTTQTITEPRLHPVPVMVESEVEETIDEPAGDRLGLRYDQCAVIEAAWTRRELNRALARIAALEAA